MFAWFPYRLNVALRAARVPPGCLVPVMAGPRRVLIAGTAALAMGASLATPVAAGSSGSLSGTISVVTMSITVSPSTANFGSCDTGNSTPTQLGFPNGRCFAPVDTTNSQTSISIANTGAAGHVEVQGSNAVPADAGTPWTLCTETSIAGTATCTGPTTYGPPRPGRDQLTVETAQWGTRLGGAILTTTPSCDSGISPPAPANCSLAAGATALEFLQLIGPTASTDASTTLTTTATWIIVP